MTEIEAVLGYFVGHKPEPRLLVSEWADKNRILSSSSASEPGLWRTSRTPYLKSVMDSLSVYATYKKVVVMKGAQLGFTEAGNNWIGYIIDNSPAPTLMVQPTDATMKRNSKMRIAPMIEASPSLRTKVSLAKSRSGENTIEQKNFPGGILLMSGANSPVGLRSVPIKNLFLDETDGYPGNLDGEGSPIDLATARTRTFAKKKIFIISTPTIAGSSVIENEFLQTDQNYFEIPCPHCGGYQKLIFEQLVWEQKKYDTVKYKCIHCDQFISESSKPTILPLGKWIPEVKDNISSDVIGFHLNSLYSPYGWYSWAEVVKDYEAAQKNPIKMVTFINTVLGETFAEESEAPAWENLYNRREQYSTNSIPNEVCFLTMGVDIQKDRIELEIVGWGVDKQSWSIDYRVLVGHTTLPEVWKQLSDVIYETWIREDGIELNILRTAIDSGFNTTEVYTFCRQFPTSKVFPIKGSDTLGMAVAPPKVIDLNTRGKRIGQVKVWQVGVSYLKKELYGWLGIQKGEEEGRPCYCHFPQYGENYFRGLTAEDWIPAKRQWKKRFERNEPLDTRVYARAAAVVVGLDRLKPDQIKALSGQIYRKREEIQANTTERRKVKDSIW